MNFEVENRNGIFHVMNDGHKIDGFNDIISPYEIHDDLSLSPLQGSPNIPIL